MKGPRITLLGTVTLWLLATFASQAEALNTDSHRIINLSAGGDHVAFDALLKFQLGFLRGARERFQGRRVMDWLGEGGVREDDGARFFRHFHDPLQPFDTAGLRLLGLQFDSSIRWMNDRRSSMNRRALVLAILAAGALTAAAAHAQEMRYWGRAQGAPHRAVIDFQGQYYSVAEGDEIPGVGTVTAVTDHALVVERVLTDADKDRLAAQGLAVHDAKVQRFPNVSGGLVGR